MTLGQLDAMPYEEYLGWQEFIALEPVGIRAHDAMHAHIISVLGNINRDPDKRREPYQIKDFLLFEDPVRELKEEPTVDGKTAAQWKLIFAAEALNARRRREVASSAGAISETKE